MYKPVIVPALVTPSGNMVMVLAVSNILKGGESLAMQRHKINLYNIKTFVEDTPILYTQVLGVNLLYVILVLFAVFSVIGVWWRYRESSFATLSR